MYFRNVLPATTNFSQSISHFAFLLRNLRLWVYWRGKVFAQLIKARSEEVKSQAQCLLTSSGGHTCRLPQLSWWGQAFWEFFSPGPFCTPGPAFPCLCRRLGTLLFLLYTLMPFGCQQSRFSCRERGKEHGTVKAPHVRCVGFCRVSGGGGGTVGNDLTQPRLDLGNGFFTSNMDIFVNALVEKREYWLSRAVLTVYKNLCGLKQ